VFRAYELWEFEGGGKVFGSSARRACLAKKDGKVPEKQKRGRGSRGGMQQDPQNPGEKRAEGIQGEGEMPWEKGVLSDFGKKKSERFEKNPKLGRFRDLLPRKLWSLGQTLFRRGEQVKKNPKSRGPREKRNQSGGFGQRSFLSVALKKEGPRGRSDGSLYGWRASRGGRRGWWFN